MISNGSRADTNFFYISGYRNGLFEGDTLFLFRDGSIELLTSPLEAEAAKAKDYEIHVVGKNEPLRRRAVLTILKECRTIGLNFAGLSHGDYLRFEKMLGRKKLVDVSDALAKTRLTKDPDELEALSRASQVISVVVEDVPSLVREGMTERDLKAQIDSSMVMKGADSPSFESIVAFGENSALPHYSPGGRELRKGDNVLIDIGAKCDLYCSDIARTFFFDHASREQKEMHQVVLEAQRRSMEAIRDGVRGDVPHLVAAHVIDGSRFAGRFTHSLGHSIGIEVHDGAGLTKRSRQKLRRDMVLTVEPGVYIPGRGGVRIEDDVVVTKDSCRLLTTAAKEPAVI